MFMFVGSLCVKPVYVSDDVCRVVGGGRWRPAVGPVRWDGSESERNSS